MLDNYCFEQMSLLSCNKYNTVKQSDLFHNDFDLFTVRRIKMKKGCMNKHTSSFTSLY